MQKKLTIVLAILAVVVFIMPSCGKYEEGPAFSLLPKKSRVANIWKIEKVFVNDVDQTDAFQEFINTYKLELTKDELINESYTTTLGTFTEQGTWAFENGTDQIAFTISGDKEVYKIIRLKSNEMWLENTVANQKFVTHYITY